MQFSSTTEIFDSWRTSIGKGVNLETDALEVLLVESASDVDIKTCSTLADITGEPTGSGYSRQALKNQSFDSRLRADDVTFGAIGGQFKAARWVIFDATPPSQPLIATGLVNSSGEAVTITDGNSLIIAFQNREIFRLDSHG